jgi:hypothetical protein
MPPTTITEPKISIGQYHHFIFTWAEYSINYLAPPEASLTVEVRDNSQYANDDEINPYEIVKYLGENHYNDTENKRDNTPQ